MNHPYLSSLPRHLRRWAHRSAGTLGLLLATAGAAQAQTPTPDASFQTATYSTGSGNNPRSIAVADVNGDGKLDLLTANISSSPVGTVGVLLGNGNGTFQAVATYSTGSGYLLDIAVADVNGDGKPDLLTASTGSSPVGTVGVLLGNSNGTFQPVVPYGTGSYPSDIAVADVNGDGKLDVLTSDSDSDAAGVLLGTGTGTFGFGNIYSTGSGSYPSGIAVADVNGDGKLDLLTANSRTSTAGVLLGIGNGTFQAVATYSTGSGSYPSDIAVADVNGDGKPDLLVADFLGNTAGVLLGNGNGTFQPVVPYGTGSYPQSIAVADVNGDGKLDLLTVGSGSSTAGVLLGIGNGTFQAVATYSTGSGNYPSDLAVADVNGDGKLDLLTANPGSYTVGVLLNTTSNAPALTTSSPTRASVGTSVTFAGFNLTGATAVRFNGTAASSFVVNSSTSLTVVVPAGATTGPVTVTTPTGTATSPTNFEVRVAPTTVADAYTTPQGVTLTGNVLSNDLGPNLRAILLTQPTNGTLVLNPNGSFTYVPNAGFVGTDSFTYYACDPNLPLLCGNPATVTITVVRVAPVTVADAYSTPPGVTLTGNVLTNDLGTNPRAILINRPTRGSLVLNPDGSFVYQPNAGFVGTDTFTYYACNMGTPLLCGDPATVSLTVVPANTATRPATQPTSAKPAAGEAPIALELQFTGHPNPFSDELQLSFTLPIAQTYTLAVYDAQGRLVQQLARSQAEAGQPQQFIVPTHTYAAGLYLVRLTTPTGSRLLKLFKQ